MSKTLARVALFTSVVVKMRHAVRAIASKGAAWRQSSVAGDDGVVNGQNYSKVMTC